jgi:iron complex transport system ATP-binding protein
MDDVILQTKELAIGYRSPRRPAHIVADNIDIALRQGGFACLLGKNGAGKSTLIRTLAGMQSPLAGEVILAGRPLHTLSARDLARRMSLVLTHRVAVGMMPVTTFVALGRHPYTDWTGRLRPRDHEVVERSISDVGIESLARRPMCELSDGERQKVKIARALAQEPQILILDEATAFLDLPRRVELMGLLQRLAHDGGRAVLLSTHDLDLALRWADRLWLLPHGGPIRDGVPEDLILDDAFSAVFSGGDVSFDKGSGSFAVIGRQHGAVALRGEGIPAMWTYRALERAGYRVLPEGACRVCVMVKVERDRTLWSIEGEGDRTWNSVEGLLAALDEEPVVREEGTNRG